MNKKVIIIGAGGHANVIADIIEKSQDEVVGFLDDNIEKGTKISNYEVLGICEDALKFKDVEFIIGIGSNWIRQQIANQYQLKWYTAIHPTAVIGNNVTIEEGTVVMANVVINSNSKIGKHCIINTGAIVEHDNMIEDYVHVSPNVTCCGTVHVKEATHLGASATVINNITIASHCEIGAGAVVVQDIEEKGTYVGVPARRLVR